jgi:hypothetical protein
MEPLLLPIMWLAVAGFLASLIVHVLALIGLPSPFGPATWLLHVGIFIVWLPSVLVAQRLSPGRQAGRLLEGDVSKLPCMDQEGDVYRWRLCNVELRLLCAANDSVPEERRARSRRVSRLFGTLDGVLLRRCGNPVFGREEWKSRPTALRKRARRVALRKVLRCVRDSGPIPRNLIGTAA